MQSFLMKVFLVFGKIGKCLKCPKLKETRDQIRLPECLSPFSFNLIFLSKYKAVTIF